MQKQVTLKITGMHCGGCAEAVEKALKGVSGVSAVRVNLNAATAWVDFDSDKASEKELSRAVKSAGFGVNS